MKGEMAVLSKSLEKNKAYFQSKFANAMDLIVRQVEIEGRAVALFAVDGLVNKEVIALTVMEPLLKTTDYPRSAQGMLEKIEREVLSAAELKQENKLPKLLSLLMSGFVLLCVDGCEEGLVSGVQGFAYRGPQEPQNEVMQRGAKDGFTESNQLNMAMIRRRMKSTALKFQPLEVGSQSHTPIILCYMEGIASEKILQRVRETLAVCPLKTVLGAGYLTGFLDRGSLFSGVGLTERPDVVCGKLEEGRIALLVEGTPSVIVLPFLFVENFQTVVEVSGVFSQRLPARAVCGGGGPSSGAAAPAFAVGDRPFPGSDAFPSDGGNLDPVLPLRSPAGGGAAGAPVPVCHGEHCRRFGAGGYRGGSWPCQRALLAGGGSHRHCWICNSPAV